MRQLMGLFFVVLLASALPVMAEPMLPITGRVLPLNRLSLFQVAIQSGGGGASTSTANTWTAQQTFSLDTANTVTSAYPIIEQCTSTGTPGVAFGCGTQYVLENASGTNKTAASLDVVWLDPVNATEDAAFSLKGMTAGAAAAEFGKMYGLAGLFTLNTTTGYLFALGGTSAAYITTSYNTGVNGVYGWSSTANATAAADTVIARGAARVVTGGSTTSYFQNTGGDSVLAADYTNATATFSSMALSKTVISGRAYAFSMSLHLTESTAADGVQLDFNGGTAAMTHFVVSCVLTNNLGAIVTQGNAISTALATVINATATVTTAQHLYQCQGGFVPSGNGTFIARAAQNAHSSGTLTILRDSSLMVNDVVAQ